MINKIILFSIGNKSAIGFGTLALVLYGIFSITRLPIDAVPDITNNQVQVITVTPTLATQEVEQFVTTPIERCLASLPDKEEIRSTSRFGLSVVTIVFKDKVDVYFARQLVEQRLKEAESQIPAGVGTPELAPVSTGLGEVYQYILHPQKGFESKYSSSDLRSMQDWIVSRQLIGTEGVAEVNSFGGLLKQYEVSVDPLRLKSMNITIPDVYSALEKNNENTGGAYIEKKPNAYFIRGLGLVTSLDDIGSIVVKTNTNGTPVLIRDIAVVQFGSAIRYGALTRNGEGEVVGGIVMMLKGANSAEVVRAVKDKIPTIQKSLPEGVTIEAFLDRTTLVNRAIGTVESNLIEGALIVIFILVLFLGDIRAGLIVASVIPLSMLFTVIMMNLFGVTGNLMSLGAIDFGLIVDGAVIIVEAILHRITQSKVLHPERERLSADQMNNEVYQSASGMMNSATFGQIIILIVYIPILTLIGIEGKMFRPMAITVSFAIIGALLLSLTYVPMMSSLFLSKKVLNSSGFSDRMLNLLQKSYDPMIRFALSNKMMVLASSLILFAGSIFVFTNTGGEFIPTLEEGDFAFHNILPGDASLSQSIENNKLVEQILMRFPEVKEVVSKTGSAEIPTDPMPPNFTDVIIILKEKDEWKTARTREALQDTMVKALQQIPGVFFEASQPIQMRFNELMTGVRQDVAIKIYGENIDTLVHYANNAASSISGIQGVTPPQVEKISGLPQITIRYDRNRIAQYGLNIRDINRVVRTAFAGDVAGFVYEDERKYDLVVRLAQSYRHDIEDVRSLYIPLSSGSQIPLVQIATVQYTDSPAQISREDAKRRIVIGINVRGRDTKSLVYEIQHKLDREVKLPAGYYFTFGGQFENLQKASERLMLAVPIALLLIFALLYFTFHSASQALLIYSAIPMSAIGGVAFLWLRGLPFSISAGVGFIALFGIAVLNGIVLMSTFNQLEKEGITDLSERVLKATRIRLRPVLMTAAVASFGFLPMAISTSAGAEVQRPLATVVIGGVLTATALTLIILPVLYILLRTKRRSKAKSVVAITLLFCSTHMSAQAEQQLTSHSSVVRLSVDSCVQVALRNNLQLQSALLQEQRQQALENSAYDFGRTGIFIENEDLVQGQPGNKGILKIGLTQTIEFPTVYVAQSKINKQNSAAAGTSVLLMQSELVRQVHQVYFRLWYLIDRQRLLQSQDTIFRDFEEAATRRYTTGETSMLAKLSTQAKVREIQLALQQITSDIDIEKHALMYLVKSDNVISPLSIPVQKLKPLSNPDTISKVSHPYLKLSQQRISLAESERSLMQQRLLPDISLRYFNQNALGIAPGYYGFSIGLGFPLLFWSQQSKMEAAQIQTLIAEKNFENDLLQFRTGYKQQIQEMDKNNVSLLYYESTGLKLSEEILKSATIAFGSGEIGYLEYTSLLAQSIEIKNNHLSALNTYNQSVIQFNYFINP